MKASPLQGSFSAGELSPLLYGRVDLDRYKESLADCKNMIPTVQGGLVRRSGTYYVNETKDSSKRSILVEFQYSIEQAYILEFGDSYIRFFKDNGVIEASPGVPYEIATPFDDAEILDLKFTQSADVLYITSTIFAPRKLLRYGDSEWELVTIDFLDGPYLNPREFGDRPIIGTGILTAFKDGTSAAQLTPGATSGSTTLTIGAAGSVTGAVNNGSGLIRITTSTSDIFGTGARAYIAGVAGTTEANGTWILTKISATTYDLQGSAFVNAFSGSGTISAGLFEAADVGRKVRIRYTGDWGWADITALNNSSQVQINIRSNLTASTAAQQWRLGVYFINNYPATCTFHEDRLCFAGAPKSPQRIDASKVGDYENFPPSDLSNTTVKDNAWSFGLNSSDVNVIETMSSDEKGLIGLSVGGEWVVRPSNQGEALSPLNVSAKKTSSYGSSYVQAIQVGRATLFIQRSGRKLREFSYFYDVDGFRATDLSQLSEHITGAGLVEMKLQKEPQSIVWMPREDGVLVGCTYDRDLDNLRVGWHRHVLGGVSDSADNAAIVESIASIPSPDGKREELWLIVKRYINGQVFRSVEYMVAMFDDLTEQGDGFFVDCGLTYDEPISITSVSTGATTVVTKASHGLTTGDSVYFSDVFGLKYTDSDGVLTSINKKSYTVTVLTANTFSLDGIDSTSWTPYISGGYFRERVSAVSNLSHLEGETVSVCVDGAAHPDCIVSGGSITLDAPASIVHVGLKYISDVKLMRIEAGASDGTALGKTRRINRVGIMLHRSLGLKIGTSYDRLDPVIFRSTSDQMGLPPPLFSGIISEQIDSDYDFDNNICLRQDQPLPLTILAVMPQLHTQDR